MIKENPLLTIKEFADAAQVSRQNIYNQLDGRLSSYVVEVDNIKMLKKSALKRFYPESFEQLESQLDSKVVKPKKSEEKQENNDKMLAILEKNIEILNNQLETKDRQIEELNKRLSDITNIVQQQQILLDQQQKLTLIDKQQPEEQQENQQENKSFWSKLFG